MSISRTSISMPADLMNDAVARQHEMRLSSFSDYIQELIRRDLAEQHQIGGPELAHFHDDVPSKRTPRPVKKPVSYKAKRARRLPPDQRS